MKRREDTGRGKKKKVKQQENTKSKKGKIYKKSKNVPGQIAQLPNHQHRHSDK